jgi:hypothetical protein
MDGKSFVFSLEHSLAHCDLSQRQPAACISGLSYRGQLSEGTEGPRGRGQGG